jgi:Rrf2 family transcriptional regulator, cysteine metabolism repressor
VKLSTRIRYGTRLMVDLALNYNKGPLMLNTISKQERVSKKYLEQIIRRLMSAHLVKSVRGPNGGYYLTKLPEKIKVLDIINAIEGPLTLIDCLKNPNQCSLVKSCATRAYWQEVQNNLEKSFANKTLKSLAKKKLRIK